MLRTKLPPTECVSSTVKYLVSLDTPQFASEGVGFGGFGPYLFRASFEGAEPKVGEMTQKQLFGSDDFTYSLGSYSSIIVTIQSCSQTVISVIQSAQVEVLAYNFYGQKMVMPLIA